jgi:hypothetical protein
MKWCPNGAQSFNKSFRNGLSNLSTPTIDIKGLPGTEGSIFLPLDPLSENAFSLKNKAPGIPEPTIKRSAAGRSLYHLRCNRGIIETAYFLHLQYEYKI